MDVLFSDGELHAFRGSDGNRGCVGRAEFVEAKHVVRGHPALVRRATGVRGRGVADDERCRAHRGASCFFAAMLSGLIWLTVARMDEYRSETVGAFGQIVTEP